MTKKNKMQSYRQGDVLLIPCSEDAIPSTHKRVKKIVLALGEVTGHLHAIVGRGAVGFADPEDRDQLTEYLSVEAPEVELTHQEHDTVTLPKGTYRSVIQSEYTPEAIRRVAD